jgi:hypothetical protein
VKHEDVHLKGYANMDEPMAELAQYFGFYTQCNRTHPLFTRRRPTAISADWWRALIVDRYSSAKVASRGSADQLQHWKRTQLKLAEKLS